MRNRQDDFERIAMVHTRSLLRVARRLVADQAEAEDLVQETMLSAWRGFHQYRAGTNARAWLFRILMNLFHARGRRTQITMVPLETRDYAIDPNLPTMLDVAEAMNGLAVAHRAVLLLGVVEGFTCQEMSEILAVPVGTVMSRMSRARQALRERLGRKCAAHKLGM